MRQVMLLNGVRETSWHVSRLDYWRWHVAANCLGQESVAGSIFLWETDQGQLAAILNAEGAGDAHLQVHPEWQEPWLLDEMLATAEAHLAVERRDRRVATNTQVRFGDNPGIEDLQAFSAQEFASALLD